MCEWLPDWIIGSVAATVTKAIKEKEKSMKVKTIGRNQDHKQTFVSNSFNEGFTSNFS